MQFLKKLYYTLSALANHPLHREAKFKAAVNFCLAQVAVRLVPGDIAVAFPDGSRLLIPPRMKGAAHFISPGLCEYDDMCFVTHFLRPAELFADVGANIGAFTVLASAVAGARTVAFEPSPATFHYLAQNARINDLGSRVRSLNVAVGAKEGKCRLTAHLGTENYVCPDGEAGGSVEVDVLTLDQVFADAAPVLMKIDVEGFETEVLAGAERLLKSATLEAMIVERTGVAQRYGYDEEALHRRIRSLSFIPCAYSPQDRKLARVPDNATGNIIYVRDFESVQKRLKNATAFQFAGHSI